MRWHVHHVVETRAEAMQIERGLQDPQVRAFVRIMGSLAALPSDRARQRVLQYVADRVAEHARDAVVGVVVGA